MQNMFCKIKELNIESDGIKMIKLKTILKEQKRKTEKVSIEWLSRTAKYIKRGDTLESKSLKKMGDPEVIKAYFPMVDPKWVPVAEDINTFIKNPEKKLSIIKKVNEKLGKLDDKLLIGSRQSINMGKYDLGFTTIDLGYLNVNYGISSHNIRLNEFDETKNKFTGFAKVKGYAKIKDGLFGGVGVSIEPYGEYKISYKSTIKGKNVKLTFYPESIYLNTKWIGMNGKISKNKLAAAVTAFIPAAWLSFLVNFRLKNNNLEIKLAAFKKELGPWKIININILPRIKKHLQFVEVFIPKSHLREQNVPSSEDDLRQLADNVAGGIKVDVDKV